MQPTFSKPTRPKINTTSTNYDDPSSQLASLGPKLKQTEKLLIENETLIQMQISQINILTSEVSCLKSELKTKNALIHNLQFDIQQSQSTIATTSSDLESCRRELKASLSDLSNCKELITTLHKNIELQDIEFDSLSSSHQELNSKYSLLKSTSQFESTQLTHLNKEIIDLLNTIDTLKIDNDDLKNNLTEHSRLLSLEHDVTIYDDFSAPLEFNLYSVSLEYIDKDCHEVETDDDDLQLVHIPQVRPTRNKWIMFCLVGVFGIVWSEVWYFLTSMFIKNQVDFQSSFRLPADFIAPT